MTKKSIKDEFIYKFHDEPPIVSSETLLKKSSEKKNNSKLSDSKLSKISGSASINKTKTNIYKIKSKGKSN